MENADADDPSLVSGEAGISAWKILSEEPYLQRVETVYQDTVSENILQTRGTHRSWLCMCTYVEKIFPAQSNLLSSIVSLFRSQAEDSVCSLAISPAGNDSTHFEVLTTSNMPRGLIVLESFPS